MPKQSFVFCSQRQCLVPKEEYGDNSRPVDTSYIIGDIAPYKSMTTGEMIGGRRQHREHLRQHGLIEVGNERVKQRPAQVDSPRRDLIDAFNGKR